jgi:hypothetical protein
MAIEIKQFTGKVDYDSPNEVIEAGSCRAARNVEWYGNLPDLRPQMVQGNQRLINPLLPGTGVNKTIGRHYDAKRHRLLFFNYNSAGNHGIYIFYTLVGTFVRIVQSGINTNGDVLGFTAFVRICNINIIYGDGQDGDLLFYVDSLQQCNKLNIDRFLNGTYTAGGNLIQRSYIGLPKPPPIPPPQCVYENDTTVTNNNMINSIFNISCAHIYDDQELSVIGSGARQALPSDPFDPKNNTDWTRNARMAIYVATGDQNVKKIRIYGTQTKDGATTAPFIIDTLVKADLGIPNNTVYRYLFYNNGNYITVDPAYAVLDFDMIPQSAVCQELLNGNVIAYGGITEGYPYFSPSLNITTQNVTPPQWSVNGTLFFAATNGIFTGGQPQITMYLTGVGTNDGFGNPITLEKYPTLLNVKAKSNGTDISFFEAVVTSNIANNLTRLQTAAVTAGWVFVSGTTNSLTVYYPTGTVTLQSAFLSGGLVLDTSPNPSAIPAHYPDSAYSYGLVYRDAAYRTNGVISNVTGNIKTQAYLDGSIPQITLNLGGFTPPPWAVFYEIVRTDTLTYLKYFDWVSAGAYQGTGQGVSTVYGYFDVSNISTYNQSVSASEGVVSYSFSPGDRIRILGRYDSTGTFTALNLDYAIIGSPTLVIANGVQKAGQFVQIFYPAGDIGPNFQFSTASNDTNFQNYKILIYSYKPYLPTNLNTFFQVGQQYGIGNPGTGAAFHMGNTADNQVTLSDGDVFYRQRTVPIISSYNIQTGSFDQTSPYGTDWVNPGGGAIPIVDNGIWKIVGGVQKVAGLLSTQYPTYVENDMTILNETTTETLSVRLRGTQTIIDKTDPNGQYAKYVKVVQPGNIVTITQIVTLQTGLQPGVPRQVTWDQTIQLPPQGKLWLINYCVNEMLIGGYLLELDVIRNLTINVFDSSISDIYALRTNSDNKPNVINVDSKTTFFETLFRYGEAYQAGTNINNTIRFFPNNFDEFLQQHGIIQRMYAWGKKLRIFQERKIGEVGVYSQFVETNTGSVSLIKSEAIITPNNIQYFEWDGGIGNQPSGLISSGYQNYLPDPVQGRWLRVSLDGVKDIGEEFNAQSFAGANLPNYLNNYTYPFGGNAVMLGCYNFKKDKDGEVLFAMQGGTNGPNSIPGQTMAFNERKNSFTGLYDINPDDIVCCENQLYSFYNGDLWVHNNTGSGGYSNFFGTQYRASVNIVFNDRKAEKKKFMSMGYQTYNNKIWGAFNVGDVRTSFTDPQSGLQQISQLLTPDFSIEEGSVVAAYLFDANSLDNANLALVQGSYLEGFWIEILLTSPDNDFNFLYLPFSKYNTSPKTP